MITCSKCTHLNDENSCEYHKGISWIHIEYPNEQSCIHAEEKREPLRLECEAKWVEDCHVGMYPIVSCVEEKLEKFHNKRTRMTLVEVLA